MSKNPTRTRNRTRLYVLALVLISELALYQCLSQLGWLGTGNAILVGTAVLFMATPILIALFLFARSRFRFGIRTLLAVSALVALFLSMTVIPIAHYNRERVGVRFLIQNRVEFDSSPAQKAWIPVWLSPIYPKERAIPDKSLNFVMLTSDSQVDAFCHVAERFPNLSSVLIYKVTEDRYRNLNQTLKKLPNLRELDIGDSEPTNIVFDSLDSLQAIAIRETTGVQSSFKDEILRDIVKLPLIETFDFHEFDFQANDLSILTQATKLKKVRFYRCRVAIDKVEALKLLMPHTEFIVERPPTPDE